MSGTKVLYSRFQLIYAIRINQLNKFDRKQKSLSYILYYSMKKFLLVLLTILFVKNISFAQTIPVGDNYLEDIARRDQITGKNENPLSFTIRPVNLDWNKTKTDSTLKNLTLGKSGTTETSLFGIPAIVHPLALRWLNEYNTSKPFGYNNSELYPAAGYQTAISAGVFVQAGPLIMQFNPQFVYAQNKYFPTFADVQGHNNSPQLLGAYFNTVNGIDAPERFGNNSLQHLYPGQSKVSIHYFNIELGISTENMWWGPGVQNAIIMSNSAPGFPHWTLNSFAPMKTAIGSFEWQLIGGNLSQSGYPPLDTGKLQFGKNLYSAKPVVSRYISALTINWQPKWIKGLYLGFSAYDYLNKDSVYSQRGILSKLIPVIAGSSNNANTISGSNANGDSQDFAFSINARQVFPEYKSEIYFEWARNDRAGSLNDLLQEPEHSSAYTLGGARLFDIGRQQLIQVRVELTHLQNPPTYLFRAEPSWYVHLSSPRDGYTNEGRYIGAGIGPGSNSFTFDISYLKDNNSFGIDFERLVHNNDLYYMAFAGTDNFRTHWVDFSSSFYANYRIKRYVISAALAPVWSLNYEYKAGNSMNLHSNINLTYYFN